MRVDAKGQMEFNASSEHQCGPGLITGGLKLARSKRVLELNMSLYVGQLCRSWRSSIVVVGGGGDNDNDKIY